MNAEEIPSESIISRIQHIFSLMESVGTDVIGFLRSKGAGIRERFGVRRIGVYGSYSKGKETEDSDIDILVEFSEPTFDNFMDLVFYLEDVLGREVDLVTPKGLSPYLRRSIEQEVVWCG